MTKSYTRALDLRAALLLGALTASTLVSMAHAESYPRIVGDSGSLSVDYGPGGHDNLVGGGRVIANITGERSDLHHLDPEYAQQNHRGLVAVVMGGGDERQIVWVPEGTDTTTIAQIGGDGSLPANLPRAAALAMRAQAAPRG